MKVFHAIENYIMATNYFDFELMTIYPSLLRSSASSLKTRTGFSISSTPPQCRVCRHYFLSKCLLKPCPREAYISVRASVLRMQCYSNEQSVQSGGGRWLQAKPGEGQSQSLEVCLRGRMKGSWKWSARDVPTDHAPARRAFAK